MKHILLLTGKNKLIKEEFFSHLWADFECLTCSAQFDDINNHLKYIKPAAVVNCLMEEEQIIVQNILSVKSVLRANNIPLVIIGSREDCKVFTEYAQGYADLVLEKPITTSQISGKIMELLHTREEQVKEGGFNGEEDKANIMQEIEELQRKITDSDNINKKATQSINPVKEKKPTPPVNPVKEEKPTPPVNPVKEEKPTQPVNPVKAVKPAKALHLRKNMKKTVGSNIVGAVKNQAAQTGDKKTDTTATNKPDIDITVEKKRKHVLVIDDEPMMLKLIKGYLHDNYDVATAKSGKVAMKFLENKTTDLILLDYEMPDENGPEVLEKLRMNPETKNIPVIFLTGIVEREKIQRALKLKPQGYVLKPIDHEKLTEIIKKQIG